MQAKIARKFNFPSANIISQTPEICDSAIAAFFADFAHFRRFCPLSQIAENFADFAFV